jgi:hypothetical protein
VTHEVGLTHCSQPGCPATVKNHRWGHTKAYPAWFFSMKTDEAWCPDHLPAWVGPGRAEQAAKKEEQAPVSKPQNKPKAKTKARWRRCPNSGKVQMLAWKPDPKDDYPGAVVCLDCSFGVLVNKGSVHPATSMAGNEWLAGKVRAHDVLGDGRHKEKMRYVS